MWLRPGFLGVGFSLFGPPGGGLLGRLRQDDRPHQEGRQLADVDPFGLDTLLLRPIALLCRTLLSRVATALRFGGLWNVRRCCFRLLALLRSRIGLVTVVTGAIAPATAAASCAGAKPSQYRRSRQRPDSRRDSTKSGR